MHPAQDLLQLQLLDPPLRPGMLASLDRFEILRPIGAGAVGIVFLARDPNTANQVAIKLLRPEFAVHDLAVRRFLAEAEWTRRLSEHPHVLSVLEISSRPQGPYFVLPFIEHGSLAKQLRPGEPMATKAILPIARQVAEAVKFAHSQTVIHCDIKPGNVLLDRQGHVHLADFGLGRTLYMTIGKTEMSFF